MLRTLIQTCCLLLITSSLADAQTVTYYQPLPETVAPTVTYYSSPPTTIAAPTVTYYAPAETIVANPPTVTYYAPTTSAPSFPAPNIVSEPVPTVTYYSPTTPAPSIPAPNIVSEPPPTVTYYSPTPVVGAPVVVPSVTTYVAPTRPGLFGWRARRAQRNAYQNNWNGASPSQWNWAPRAPIPY